MHFNNRRGNGFGSGRTQNTPVVAPGHSHSYSQEVQQHWGQNPGGTTNAPDNRENYQLGGQIPGDLGFGEKPMANPLPSPGRMPGTAGYEYEEGGKTNKYKKK